MAQQFPPQMLASALSPSNGFGAPPLAPDVLAQQQRVQQQAMLAQSLLGQEPLQGQMVSGHYVPPNPLQGLARALQTYAGYRTMADLPQEQQKLQEAQQQALARQFGLAMGGQQAEAAPGAPMQEGQPSFPLLPGRSAQESYMLASQLGVPEYLKLAAQQGAPTDTQRDLMAAGLQPGSPEYQSILRSNAARPMNVAPGGTLFDPVTQQPIFNAPQDGRQVQFGPGGRPRIEQVPGWNEAEAARAQAMAEGQAAGRVIGEYEGQTQTGERERARAEAASAIDASIGQLQRLKETAELVRDHPGFGGVSGLNPERLTAIVPGTQAADAVAQFDTLRSQIAQNVLQMYRQMSETGGAVGQVSNQEQAMFQNNLAALSRNQSPKAMRESLDRIIKFVDESTGRLKSAYDRQYGEGAFNRTISQGSQPAAPSTGDFSSLWGG